MMGIMSRASTFLFRASGASYYLVSMPPYVATLVLVLVPPVLWLAESAWPIRERVVALRIKHLKENAWKSLPVLIVGTIAGFGTAAAAIWAQENGVGLLPRLGLQGWQAVLAGFILFELGDYLRHMAMHKLPFLWHLHRVHHDDDVLDFSTAFRNHPVENIVHGLWHAGWVVLCGIPLLSWLIRVPVLFFALWFQHANVRIPGDSLIAWVMPSPLQHREHHAFERGQADCNYGVVITIFDRIFGTFRSPPRRQR
jgi:sterol desaturase/sphingolipid hydroxylase (fatty acid hydroxylase superfamily)